MDIKSEKLEIISWLSRLNDENVIAQIKSLIKPKQDWWDELSPELKDDIDAGLNDLENGRHTEFSEILKKYNP